MADLTVETTTIPGLLVVTLPVHADARGWFKENWQREKMLAAGLPDFGPVQNNVSYNTNVGATRGIHAEPWDKYVAVTTGRIFGAWVDLRAGDSFGAVFTLEVGPDQAVFVPRGVGNSYQTLEPATAYTYLVNDHWSPAATYAALNLADETAAIAWPIPLDQAEISDKDLKNPRLADVTPMPAKKTLIVGGNGQLGRALQQVFPDAHVTARADFDLANPDHYTSIRWRDYATVVNAAAYTKVDEAETPDGRVAAWRENVTGVALLARACTEHGVTLVHVSSDYVFDGTTEIHTEDEPFSPLGVYGQTKAAGDAIVTTVPKHYIIRTSWVIGEGHNFVRTMASLAERGIAPSVVGDQYGRLTFTATIADAILHLVETKAAHGTYDVTNAGDTQTWADIAKHVYRLTGHDPDDVTAVTTEAYFSGKQAAPRPTHSTLDLTKIGTTGYTPDDSLDALERYLG